MKPMLTKISREYLENKISRKFLVILSLQQINDKLLMVKDLNPGNKDKNPHTDCQGPNISYKS